MLLTVREARHEARADWRCLQQSTLEVADLPPLEQQISSAMHLLGWGSADDQHEL